MRVCGDGREGDDDFEGLWTKKCNLSTMPVHLENWPDTFDTTTTTAPPPSSLYYIIFYYLYIIYNIIFLAYKIFFPTHNNNNNNNSPSLDVFVRHIALGFLAPSTHIHTHPRIIYTYTIYYINEERVGEFLSGNQFILFHLSTGIFRPMSKALASLYPRRHGWQGYLAVRSRRISHRRQFTVRRARPL